MKYNIYIWAVKSAVISILVHCNFIFSRICEVRVINPYDDIENMNFILS